MTRNVKIKFYFHQNVNNSNIDASQNEKVFHIDNKIEAINLQMLSKLLERHQIISSDNIDHIRFYHCTYKAWILMNEEMILELKGDSPYLKILIKSRNNQIDYCNDPTEHTKTNIIQRIKKIKALIEYKTFDETLHNYSMSSTEANVKSELDVAILHGNPLYDAELKYYYKSIYDYHANITCLREILGISLIGLSIDFGLCTIESFEQCIKKYPKVINIVCGSGYDSKGAFYLYFENAYKEGEVERLNEEKLSIIFNDCEDYKQQVIIIIMTPYAENAMQMFKDQNFENIVTVHTTSSNKNTSNKFITLFYENLFNNKNPQEAFDNAKTIVVAQLELGESKNCCCFHNHKENCKWKYFSINNPEEAHFKHMKYTCKCKKEQFHHHLSSCAWAKNFEYKISQLNLCCCQGTLEHTISSTIFGCFSMNYNEADEGIVFYNHQKGINGGQQIISGKSFLSLNNNSFPMTRLVGKSEEMYQVIKLLLEKNMRFITVFGHSQIDQTIFGQVLWKYLYERTKKNVGVEYKAINDYGNIVQLEKGFIKEDNERIVIINCKSINDDSLDIFKQTINRIYLRNKHIKIVTISIFAIEIEYSNEVIELKRLDEPSSKIFLINEKSHNSFKNFETMIKKSQGISSKLITYKNNSKPLQNFKRTSSAQSDQSNLYANQQEGIITFEEFYSISKEHNFPELPLLFYHSPYGFLSVFLQIIYEGSFVQVMNLIQENEQNSFFKKTSDHGYEDYKIEPKISNENYAKIPKEVKQKSIMILFNFYSKLWRSLINNVYITEDFINFSAAQNYGIWLSLDETAEIIKKSDKKDKLEMSTVRLYHDHAFQNFMSFFNEDNLNIIHENKEIWNKIKVYIEELSICIPSFMKIIKNSKVGHVTLSNCMIDLDNNIYTIQNHLEKYKSEFVLGSLRLALFKYLDGNNTIDTIINLKLLVEEFKKLKYWHGAIEALFSIAVVTYQNNRNGKNTDQSMEEAKKYAIEVYNNITIPNNINKEALEITLGRIYFQSALYHINNGFTNEADLKELHIADQYFQKTSRIFYELKTKHLISHWYSLCREKKIKLSEQKNHHYYTQSKSYLDKAKLLAYSINQPELYDEIKKEMQCLAQPSNLSRNHHQSISFCDDEQNNFIVKINQMLNEQDNTITFESDNVIIGQEKILVVSLGKNILYLSGDIKTLGENKSDTDEICNLVSKMCNKKRVELIMLHMAMRNSLKDIMIEYGKNIVFIDGYNEKHQKHMRNVELFTIEVWKKLINKETIEKTFNAAKEHWSNKLSFTLISLDSTIVIDFL